MSRGALAFWADVAAEGEDDFNEWYFREHIPDRLGHGGFRSGRRYRAISGGPRYMALYETDSLEVLRSPEYVALLENPTPWTQRVMRHCHNTVRTIGTVRHSAGLGFGTAVTAYRLAVGDEHAAAFMTWLRETAFPAALAEPQVVAARVWQADPGITGMATKEKEFRAQPDAIASWIVLVEAMSADATHDSCRKHLSESAMRTNGAMPGSIRSGVYQMLFGLEG